MVIARPQDGESRDWTLGDLIDFERAVASVACGPDSLAALAGDGKSLEQHFAGQSLDEVPRPQLFRRWLDIRRRQDSSLFGREIDRVFRVFGIAGWVVGGVAGFLAAGGYLEYNGAKPVNVMWFLFWLVLCPWIVTGLGIAVSCGLRDGAGPKLLGGPMGSVLSRLSPKYRELWQAWTGALHQHGSRLAPIAVWPILGISQRFACGFGLGALAGLLGYVIGVDLAFGWESTLNVGAEAIHAIVRWVAAPWLWLFPGSAPTLEQVRDSRFTHLVGLQETAIPATRAWWPFLVGCLALYAVIPRFVMIQLTEWRRRRSLARLDFKRAADGELARGLWGPLFVGDRRPKPDGGSGPLEPSPSPRTPSQATWTLLVAEGLDADSPAVRDDVRQHLPGTVTEVLPVEIDYAIGNQAILEAIEKSSAGLVVAIPASTDPLDAMRLTLAELRKACGGRDRFIVLFGSEERRMLWKRWAQKPPVVEFGIIQVPRS
jgi:hypothetical protein